MRRWMMLVVAGLSLLCPCSPVLADTRIALVIGNSAYRSVSRLENPKHDAELMAETLQGLGFTLIGGGPQLDLDEATMRRAVQTFGAKARGADVALVYYAGHGVQVRGANYLVPVDANPAREADVDFQMLDVNVVLRQMESAGTKLNLVILDACRNNPFGGRGLRDGASGLAQMRAPEGTLISFATQPGNVALDGSDGNSPFTKALAETIRRPGLDIFKTFNQVGLEVKRATGGTQQPWVSSSPVDGDFYFAGQAYAPASTAQPAPSSVDPAERAWAVTQNTTSIAVLEDFVRQFGGTPYGSMARARIEELKKTQTAARPAETPIERAQAILPNPHLVPRVVKRNVSQGYLNLRREPGQKSEILTRIPAGETAMVGGCLAPGDGISRYPSCRAVWNGVVGWVSANGLE
ncbi:Peptidase C14, caspase catalytic subunit p20 precursor [Bradyrhizobium sp. ORS 375]|uniref:caspase family protein n=1 Tax=Bradyrhizobium sp. (strain ORS 375) TaxID=566679 RepID=UPI0002408B7B|nr:caspase family protein [Bradyrhizobium sp. ORS 375]CCD93870.1 Peptidase C14, caspase catalytic subunit p20 precursor [Bradyrhizobium sp. ORS 375]